MYQLDCSFMKAGSMPFAFSVTLFAYYDMMYDMIWYDVAGAGHIFVGG